MKNANNSNIIYNNSINSLDNSNQPNNKKSNYLNINNNYNNKPTFKNIIPIPKPNFNLNLQLNLNSKKLNHKPEDRYNCNMTDYPIMVFSKRENDVQNICFSKAAFLRNCAIWFGRRKTVNTVTVFQPKFMYIREHVTPFDIKAISRLTHTLYFKMN